MEENTVINEAGDMPENDLPQEAAEAEQNGERTDITAEAPCKPTVDERDILRRALINERVERRMESDLAEIKRYSPEIDSLDDLCRLDCYGKIVEHVRHGLCIADAYKLCNYDNILKNADKAAYRRAENRFLGKEHLRRTEIREDSMTYVPSEIYDEYRALMPDVSESEIRHHYERYTKK